MTVAPPAGLSDVSPWYAHRRRFEQKAARPLPPLLGLPAPAFRPPLAAVLARFQLGEAGEGRVAREIDDIHLPGVDDSYRAALKLFVKEEGRHARILAMLVRQLDGRLLRSQGSNTVFKRCRRLFGLRFKLVVLLVAEVVGAVMYEALARRWGGAGAVPALAEMAADERHHLIFHAEFLRGQVHRWPVRLALRAGLWLVAAGAAALVLRENADDLRRLSLAPRALAAQILARLKAADALAFGRGDAPEALAALAPRPAIPGVGR